MESSISSAEGEMNVPLSLGQITAFRNGEQPEHLHDGVGEREIWAICELCCAVLQAQKSDDFMLCPQSIVLHPDGNITLATPEGDIGTEFQAPEVATLGISEKSVTYSLGKTLLYLKDDLSSDSALYHLLHNLISEDPCKRLALAEVEQLSKLALHKLQHHHKEREEQHEQSTVQEIHDVNGNKSKETNSPQDSQPTKDKIHDSPSVEQISVLNHQSEYSQREYFLVRPVVQAAYRRQDKMASGSHLGPPSLEAFWNLSPRAQEILRKIYSSDTLPKSEGSGVSKGGSDSNLSSFNKGASYFTSDGNREGRLDNSNPPTKRNSIGSTAESLLQPKSLNVQGQNVSRRYSTGDRSPKSLGLEDGGTSSSNVSPVPIITVSRPDSETPPIMSENRQRANSMQSAVTTQVSNALTKFMKSRQISSGNKSQEKTDGQEKQKVEGRPRRESEDYSSSLGGTDDEHSSGHHTDGDLFMLDDPFMETESEAEGDSIYSNRMRSNSIANCNIFNSKTSAFRATHSKAGRKSTTSLSHLSEIQEEEHKPSSESSETLLTTGSTSSAYSNIKDLAMLRSRRASHTHAQKSNDLVSSTTHFTPIVLTKAEGSVRSPVMDEAKVKAKKAMELIKLDLKAPRKEKPPPTLLQDLENDAAEFIAVDQGNSKVQPVKKMGEQTEVGNRANEKQLTDSSVNKTKSELATDQKVKELTTDQKLKMLFEKHGLGSPNPSPRSSPNPLPRSVSTSGKTAREELVEKSDPSPVMVSAKVTGNHTHINEIKEESNLVSNRLGEDKMLGSEHSISPIFKMKPVTVVQNSPLNEGIGFAPIFKPEEVTKAEDVSDSTPGDPVPTSSLKAADKSSTGGDILRKTSLGSDNVTAFHKHGTGDETRDEKEATEATTPKGKDKEAAKSQMGTIDSTAGGTSIDDKMGEANQTTITAEPLESSKGSRGNMSSNSGVQEKPKVQLVHTGSVVSFEASSASDITALTVNASQNQDMAKQLTLNNIPIQVQLHQDPQTGLYRVVPMGVSLQGLPVHVTSSCSTPSSPVQSTTNSNATMISPVQAHSSSPSSLVSSSSMNKSFPRKKKFVDTSSDPDSSVLSHRHQHRSPAERKKDHTKKRGERTKYSASPHKKSFGKLPLSNLITDSESSESSFSSPVPSTGHEKSHVRPHRRKPTKSPASSSHGDSDHRKERHRDQLNTSRSPQAERLKLEHRSQNKSREKSCHTPSSHSTTPTHLGDNRKPHVKSSHHSRTAVLTMTDDTDDTRPIDHTLMPSSPISVSMSSPSRDSGVHLRYTTSSGEDLPMMQEAHLVDALQSNSHLKKVIKQIRQAFAFDGYLENGVEDLQMAEYISSLASVTFTTFSSAVTEKFCDLYWEEELLEGLYEAVNGQKPSEFTNKSTIMPQKSSDVRRKSKEIISQENDTKEGNRGRTEGKRNPSEKTPSDAARKMTPKSQEMKTKRGDGASKSKEKVAQRKFSEVRNENRQKQGTRTDKSREKRMSSTEQPRQSSSKKVLSKGDTENGRTQKQNGIEAGDSVSTDQAIADAKRMTKYKEDKDATHDRERETKIHQKDKTEGRKQEDIGGNIQEARPNKRESKVKSEEASERRTRKVSTDSKDGRESRNSRDGRERKGGRGNRERREDDTQSRKFGNTDNLLIVEEGDVQKSSSMNQTHTDMNQQRISQERSDQNNSMRSQESLLLSSKDSSHVDLSSHDSDQYNDSLYLSSTSDLSSSLPLPKQQSTPVLNKTLPVTKSEVIQARLAPTERNSPSSTQGPHGASRRDSIASFSSTSSGTSSRTHQSFATSSLADSMMESSIEESRLVMPSGVLFSGEKVDPSVAEYAQNLTGCGDTQNSIESKISEVDQQLTLEKRSQKKTSKFYRKLQEKVSSENKSLVSKVKQELEETNQKIEFLESAKRHLEILYAEQWGLDFGLLYSFATISDDEMLVRKAENPLLTMHTMRTITTLQAGESKGLFSYLYARQALLDGYLPHFFYTYHYFATSQQLLDFITSRFLLACKLNMRNRDGDVAMSIIARTIDILHVWIEGFFDVDFKPYPQFLQELVTFVSDQMVPVEQQSKFLLQLLERRQQDAMNGLTSVAARVQNSDSSLPTISKPVQPLPWQVPNSSQSEKTSGFKASLMACFIRKPSKQQESLAYSPAPHQPREGFHMSDYTSQTIAHILTLIQQALFILVHPIHFLNSRCYSISVKDTAKSPYSLQLQPSKLDGEGNEAKSLFTQKVFEGKEIRDLLDLGQVVSHWVSAEVVSSSSAKAQVALLSKFISVAKTCFELRNFASCVQILDGLDNVIVRQVPAWRDLPSKMVSVYEDLNASRVLLQGDSEYLMKGDKKSPTLPATLLFLLHVQQLEIGGFQLTNGMFKWTKLRSIAKLVDQIRIFQEISYSFDVDSSLPGLLKQRMEEFSSQDIHVLAARHSSNYHQLSSDKGRKFTSTFQKMKAGLH